MNKKPFKSMSNEAALDFILYQIKPGNQPLGMPFGWVQPDKDHTITLGSIYVSSNLDISPRKLFYAELYDYKKGYYYEGDIQDYPLWGIKALIKAWKSECRKEEKVKDKELNISGIFDNENIHCQYSDLEREERLLYHLAIMALNTMTEAHNWACSYLEYLAYNHYNLKDHGKNWNVYIPNECMYPDIMSALNDLLDCGDLAEKLELYGYTIDNAINDDCYHYFNEWENDNTDVQEWIKSLLEDTNKLDEWDIRDYDSEIISTLAAMIEWIKSEWITGNLTFDLSPDMPKDLYNWYSEICNQMTIPGIE